MRSWTSSRDAIKSTPGTSPPHLGGKTGRDWGQEEKGTTEDEMAGPKGYSDSPRVTSEASKVKGEELDVK